MKLITIIILSAAVFAVIIMALPSPGGVMMRSKLEAIVDDYISTCEAKSALLNSSSANIRRSAMCACLKAAFCKHAKAELIDALVANNVAPKPYKVRRFLNTRFNEVAAAKDIVMAIR
jgi:phosphoribosylpyrophosphate synthetase